MSPASWYDVLAAGQLVLAGFMVDVGVHELGTAWRLYRTNSAFWLGISAFLISAVLLVNTVAAYAAADRMELILLVRTALLSGMLLSLVPLVGNLHGDRAPLWLMATLTGLAAVRLVLWVSTDLVYAHRLDGGLPVYGPLLPFVGVPPLALAFGYVVFKVLTMRRPAPSGRHAASARDQMTLAAGVLATAVLTVISIFLSNVGGELLTGYLAVPVLLSTYVIVRRRVEGAHLAQRRLAVRHKALAELGGQVMAMSPEAMAERSAQVLVRQLDAQACEIRADGVGTVSVEHGPDGRRGLAVTAPLLQGGKPSGQVQVLGVPRTDEAEHEFVTAVAHLLSESIGRHHADEALRHRATHDQLTGLPNRLLLHDRLRVALGRVPREGNRVAVLFCDLNGFKSVNDAHGHPAGDALLAETARRLQETVRATDTVGRFGGDEFVVVCPRVTADVSLLDLAERIGQAVSRPVEILGTTFHMTVSIGISVEEPGRGDGVVATPDAMLRDADTAMFRAKERSRQTAASAVEVFDNDLRARLLRRIELRDALAQAAPRGEIVLHYQPIIHLPTGRVHEMEALARWQRADGLLPPDEWVPLAETSGHIVPIGAAVLADACHAVQAWGGEGAVGVAVNVAPAQLESPSFVPTVEQVLASGFPARRLCLEVTETAFVGSKAAVDALALVRSLGVQVALDDFGTGYSSMSALGRLPLDVVKIDRSFTARLRDREGVALAAAVLELGHVLDLTVIVEGVESEDQMATVVDLGCEYAQGFLLGQPAPLAV